MKKKFSNLIDSILTYILLKLYKLLKILQTRHDYEINIFNVTMGVTEATPLAFLVIVIFTLLFVTIFIACLYYTLNPVSYI
jgi:hypothetical protein